MRGTNMMQMLWAVFLVSLIVWIAGLAAGWGGWVWVFFVIALATLGANVLAITGRRR